MQSPQPAARMGDEAASDALLGQTWHCHCAPAFSDFSTERLKAVVCGALPSLRDLSGDRHLVRRVRPSQLVDGSAVGCEVVCVYFLVASRKSTELLAGGFVCNTQEVALVLIAGQPKARGLLVEHLGGEFKAKLQPLQLAPWQLAMATAYGLTLAKSEDPPESSLELRLEGGVNLGFEASVLAEVPVTEEVAEIAGRQTLQLLYQIASSWVLSGPYERLRLRGVIFSRLFSLDHGGVLELRSEVAAVTIPGMLLSIAREVVLGVAAPQLEEASTLEESAT